MSKRRRHHARDYGIPDVFGIGDQTYVVTGPAERIGVEQPRLAEITERGPVKKVTLVVGLDRGVTTGVCRGKPRTYKVGKLAHEFLALREGQLGDPSKVGATVMPARGTYKGAGETTRIIEVLYRKNDAERSFTKFRDNMLKLGESIARRLCQERVLAVVKNGADEREWDLTYPGDLAETKKRRRK